MSFGAITLGQAKDLGQIIEKLSKSWSAGYQGIQNAGRTGVSALAHDQLDSVIRSITMEEEQFLLTKDMDTLKASQSVYMYTVETAIQSNLDLAGWEAFLPQEDTSKYLRVAEVLKVYGIKKSITHMAQLINDGGGYQVDLEERNDKNASMAMAQAMERDSYYGGDFFMNASGDIDGTVAADLNLRLRNVRGIQANIREGDRSERGIPGDFVGYMNAERSVVTDNKGNAVNREIVDQVVTNVSDNLGSVAEAHCTTSQLQQFRATFFPFERGDLGANYAIRGAGVTNDEKAGFPLQTVKGTINFIPTVFRYTRQLPYPIQGAAGSAPATPAVAVAESGLDTDSPFIAGESYTIRVQAANIHGLSQASASSSITIAASGHSIEVSITNVANAEYYKVFASPKEASGSPAGKEFFVGNVLRAAGATTFFRHNGRVVPGLESILFLPKNKNRAKMAILGGNLLHKLQLGLQGTASETVYVSYIGIVVDRPRTFALLDNCFQVRAGL